MKRSVGLIIIVAAAVAVVAVATASRPARARIDSVVAVAPAHAARTVTADVPIKIRSAADAGALVARAPFASDLGLSPDDVAATRAIYRFDSGTAGFAEGLSAYRTPLARGGFCISFAAGTSCTRTPPSPSEAVIGIGFDPDAERAGEPFVLVGITAPEVRSVTYTCDGKTYPSITNANVVVFVAPNSSLRADDCTENATLANGVVVSKRV